MSRIACLFNIFLFCQVAHAADIVVSEFMAINDRVLADEFGEYDDWVELVNTSEAALDLAGIYLSNDPDDPTLWQILEGANGETFVQPQGRVLLWFDKDPGQGSLHVPFRLAGSGGTLLLTEPDGETLMESISYPPQHPDIAYGRMTSSSETFLFLLSPTPGKANDPTGVSEFGGVSFSKDAGLFRDRFELSMSTVTEEGTVKFTTDGNVPGLFAGKTFTDPLQVETSTTIRAAVFIGGKQVSPLQSQIYLAIDADLAAFDSNLPIVLIDSRGHDFTKDTSTSTNFDQSPVSSVFLEPNVAGRTNLTEISSHLGSAGMHVRGASSREWPKQQYRFETWGDTQEDRDVDLLGSPSDSDWILAAPYFDRSLMRNYLTFRWWAALGYESPRAKFCELFLDMDGDETFTLADYQGVYVLTETIKRSADRLDIGPLRSTDDGGFEGSYAIEATNVNQNWVSRKGIRLKYVEPREAEPLLEAKAWIVDHFNDLEAAVHSDDFAEYARLIDLPSHLDYDIMRELSRNIDGASTFLSFREGKVHMGPLWDYNQSFGLTSLFEPNPGWKTEGWNVEYMTEGAHWMKWWDHLGDDPEYQTAWEDRWVVLREGALSNECLLGDVEATAGLLEEAAERNFKRWDILGKAIWVTGGGTRADPGENDRDTFAKEVAFVRDWLTARLRWIDSQVPAPPSFGHPGGAAPEGFVLEMGETAGFKAFGGTIHYTTDGSDPRLRGGAVHAEALPYQEPVPLNGTVTISARTRSLFGKWSALRQATYLVCAESASADNLTISEIYYNPKGSDSAEFIELVNRGDRTIDLTGVRLAEGVEFTFGRMALKPGEVVLVVEDSEAYPNHASVAGSWKGRLANSGETIQVLSANGDAILSLSYGDAEDWPEEADGNGASLERVNLDGDPKDASSWRASANEGGTPGSLPTAGALMPFVQWQDMHFTDAIQQGAEEDPDQDGHMNLVEYAFGSDPRSPASFAEITISPEGPNLSLRYPDPQDRSVIIGMEASNDLKLWEPLEPASKASTNEQTVVTWTRDRIGGYVRLLVQLPVE